MLQYIINSSVIWLVCLLVYEFLFRKETFHQFNRIYLLASLVTGLLLPLANIDNLVPNNVLHKPTEQVYEVKRALFIQEVSVQQSSSTATDPGAVQGSATILTSEVLLWSIYMIGVAVGFLLLLREIFYLVRLYRSGTHKFEEGILVIETGKNHCSFAFFNTLFVRTRKEYSSSEWTFLLAHEKEHSRRYHSLDNMLLILTRMAFWFHPLIHLYHRRLRMVHEYQADDFATLDTAAYGTFLLEQTLMGAAPAITHSINYSPLKKRIAMLTGNKSARTRQLKYLSVIPLLIVLSAFCTEKEGNNETAIKTNKIQFKGNEIELAKFKVYPPDYIEVLKTQRDAFQYASYPDSFPVKHYRTGDVTMHPAPVDTVPVAINGKPILGNEAEYVLPKHITNYQQPVFIGPGKDLEKHLFQQLHADLNKLDDGVYLFDVNRIVIDDHGNVAYFESNGMVSAKGWGGTPYATIRSDLSQELDQKIVSLLNGRVKFKPAVKEGKPVNARVNVRTYAVEVKNHAARLVQRGGC